MFFLYSSTSFMFSLSISQNIPSFAGGKQHKTNIHETKQTHPSGSVPPFCRKRMYGTNHTVGKQDGDRRRSVCTK